MINNGKVEFSGEPEAADLRDGIMARAVKSMETDIHKVSATAIRGN